MDPKCLWQAPVQVWWDGDRWWDTGHRWQCSRDLEHRSPARREQTLSSLTSSFPLVRNTPPTPVRCQSHLRPRTQTPRQLQVSTSRPQRLLSSLRVVRRSVRSVQTVGANVFDWSVVSTHQVHARFPWDQVCVRRCGVGHINPGICGRNEGNVDQ